MFNLTILGIIGLITAHATEPTRYVKAVYSAPLTFDPAQMNDTSSLLASNLIYDGLLNFDADLELQGALAESWSASRDGLTLRFKLRKDAKFQNGEQIVASDVVRSFTRLIGPKSKVYNYYDCIEGAESFHKGQKPNVSGLKAVAVHELEIKLRYPFPPFFSVLAGATAKVLPRQVSEPKFFDAPIGSGPFRFVKKETADQQSDLIFESSTNYYGTHPKVSQLVLRAVDEKEALKQAQDGVIQDLSNWPLTGKEAVFKNGQHLESPVAATWIIGLNARLAPFQNRATRQAFRDSIDTDAFRLKFFPDAVKAQGYIPPGLPGFEWRMEAFKPTKARATTKQVIRIALPKILKDAEEMKKFIEESLRAHGWKAEVVLMGWDEMMKGYSNKSLQAFLVSMNMDYPDTEFLVRNFDSTNLDNFSGLKDSKVDALIRQARATNDRIARQNIYVDLVKHLHFEAVTIDLFHPRGHYWVSDCVQGLEPNMLADYYMDYRKVSFKSSCHPKRASL